MTSLLLLNKGLILHLLFSSSLQKDIFLSDELGLLVELFKGKLKVHQLLLTSLVLQLKLSFLLLNRVRLVFQKLLLFLERTNFVFQLESNLIKCFFGGLQLNISVLGLKLLDLTLQQGYFGVHDGLLVFGALQLPLESLVALVEFGDFGLLEVFDLLLEFLSLLLKEVDLVEIKLLLLLHFFIKERHFGLLN